jgi:nucleotide-binding universal stress UspA family protein
VFEHVVVGVTDSDRTEPVLERAMAIVRASGGTLHLVTGFKAHRPSAPRMPEEFRYSLAAVDPVDYRLNQLAARARQADIAVRTHAVLSGPVDALTTVARDEAADLIVVGAAARRPGYLADVPRAVTAAAACAVLVV